MSGACGRSVGPNKLGPLEFKVIANRLIALSTLPIFDDSALIHSFPPV